MLHTRYSDFYSDTDISLFRDRYILAGWITAASTATWAYLTVTPQCNDPALVFPFTSTLGVVCLLVSFYCFAIAYDPKLRMIKPGTPKYDLVNKLVATSPSARLIKEKIDLSGREIYNFDLAEMIRSKKRESRPQSQMVESNNY